MPHPIRLEADARARAWLKAHPASGPRVVAYEVHRCCGGGKICLINVRGQKAKDVPDSLVSAKLDDGTEFLIDPQAAGKLPERFNLTVRGVGPFEHLDLDLSGEQWGALLYD
jgi:hypothetical protein